MQRPGETRYGDWYIRTILSSNYVCVHAGTNSQADDSLLLPVMIGEDAAMQVMVNAHNRALAAMRKPLERLREETDSHIGAVPRSVVVNACKHGLGLVE